MLIPNGPNDRAPRLVSAIDVAQALHISVSDVHRLARTGALPSHGRGLARRYDLAVIMSNAKTESNICPSCGGVFATQRDLVIHERLAHDAPSEESESAS